MAPDRRAILTDHNSGFQRVGFSRQLTKVVLCRLEIGGLVEGLVAQGQHLVAADHQAGTFGRHPDSFELSELHRLVPHREAVCPHRVAEGFFIHIRGNAFHLNARCRQKCAAALAGGRKRDGEAHECPQRSCSILRIPAAVSSTERRETSIVFQPLRWKRRLA